MPKRFRLIVFDWDGTLIDSTGLIVSSLQSACRDIGIGVPAEAAARHIIGLGLRPALMQLLPDLTAARYPELTERYRYHFLSRDHEAPLFTGVHALLDELQSAGHLLAVATGKSRAGLERSFDHTGIRAKFIATRCADESFSKPHPGMLEELMRSLAVTPREVLMIGDTTHDLDMATNAGVAAAAVSYGAHPKQELLSRAPAACFDSVAEASAWLLRHA